MVKGQSLSELAADLERRETERLDMITPTSAMEFDVITPEVVLDGEPEPKPRAVLNIDGHGLFSVNDRFNSQLATWTGVPTRYARRMLSEAPELWRDNVSHWVHQHDKSDSPESKRMVRTLDGTARALLSSRYQIVDGADILRATLPAFQELQAGGLSIKFESVKVTEETLYLQVVFPSLTGEVMRDGRSVGDVVQAGMVISNGEVGNGSVSISPLIYRLVCTNGMISQQAMSRRHVGARVGGESREVFQLDTQTAELEAIKLKVRDTIMAGAQEVAFQDTLQALQAAADDRVQASEPDPVKVVDVIKRAGSLTDSEGSRMLRELARSDDYSRWGVANAITATANEHDDYERAVALETLGGAVMTQGSPVWSAIAAA